MKTIVFVTCTIFNKATDIVIRMMHLDYINTFCTKKKKGCHRVLYEHCSKVRWYDQ